MLAVPAAALMLGAAHAQSTVGLNFQTWYYDSGNNPQTIGWMGTGYSAYNATGFPVTAKAFGVSPANWFNTDPIYGNTSSPINQACTFVDGVSTNFAGSLSCYVNSPKGGFQSGSGCKLQSHSQPYVWPDYAPGVFCPQGNDEALWGIIFGNDANPFSVSVSGLAAKFPHGYVIQSMAAVGNISSALLPSVDFTDGTITNTAAYHTWVITNSPGAQWPRTTAGLSDPSGAFTADTIYLNSRNDATNINASLAGVIITDQPVVTQDPTATSLNLGDTLILSANSIGLTNALAYQWQHAGTNIFGANSATYTKAGVTANDAGDYALVVTNLYGAATSGTATVSVIAVPTITTDLTGTTNTVYSGANFSGWSIVAVGALPLQYNWFRNGTVPVGGNSPTLTLTNVSAVDNGNYAVTVVNSYGLAKSGTNHLTVVTSPNLYTTDVVKDSPNAFWPLNESSGSIANDYSGNGKNGTNNGGITLSVAGPRPPAYQGFDAGNTAYQFDGGSAYIDCGTGPSLSGLTDFTLEAWINTTATANGMIIQQRSSSGYNGEYEFQVTAGGNLEFMIYGNGYQYDFTTTQTVNDGQWHYVAAVRSGSNGYIYIDGKLAASASGTPAPLDPTIQTYIGSDQRGSSAYFNGSISDLAIYGTALSANDITLHAYNGLNGNAPFSISIIPGGYVADSKPAGTPQPGLNHNASWTNSVTDFNSPPVTRNGVEVFSGNSQIAIPTNTVFDSANGTIVFWLQANAPLPVAGSEGAMLFDRRTTNGMVIVLSDAGTIKVQWSGSPVFEANTYIPDNNWHHVAITYDQSLSGAVEVFVDGVSYGSQLNTTDWSWPTSQQLEIGRSHDTYWKVLNGQMDDFRIYNRILTQPEIASIQGSDALVDTSALKVRYNFDTAGAGMSLSWPAGVLESSPALGASALWTIVSNAIPPYPFLPPAPTVPVGSPNLFYRAGF